MVLASFLPTCLVNSSDNILCCTPKILKLTFTILFGAILALMLRFWYQHIREKLTDSVRSIDKDQEGLIPLKLSQFPKSEQMLLAILVQHLSVIIRIPLYVCDHVS